MMKNNQMFQRLGLSTLASMINNTSSKSKDDVSQESGSLYDLRIVRALNKRRLARIPRLLRVYVKIHPTLLATSLLEDLEDLREW